MSSLAGQGDARAGHGSAGPFATASRVRSLGDGTFTADAVRHVDHRRQATRRVPRWRCWPGPRRPRRAAVRRSADPLTVSAQFLRAPEIGPGAAAHRGPQDRPPGHGRRRAPGTAWPVLRGGRGDHGPAAPRTRGVVGPAEPAGRAAGQRARHRRAADGVGVPPDRGLRRPPRPERRRLPARPDQRPAAPAPVGPAAQRAGRPVLRAAGRRHLHAGDVQPRPLRLDPDRPADGLDPLPPAPGWLRVQVDCKAVHGPWFDSDATVVDSTGRLVCQSRQLALSAKA